MSRPFSVVLAVVCAAIAFSFLRMGLFGGPLPGTSTSHEAVGNAAASAGWLARAARLINEFGLEELRGWLLLMQAYEVDPVTSEGLAREAKELAATSGDLDLELCALSEVGSALVSQGRVKEGLTVLDEAMAGSLGEGGTFDTVVFTSCNMISSCARSAEFGRAVEWIRAADRFTERYGCPFLFVYCRTLYGGVLIASGDWVQAEEELLIAVAESKQSQLAVHIAALATLAALRLAQGRLDEAEGLIAGIEEQSAAVHAGLHLARGRAAAAAAAARRALDSGSASQLDAAVLVELLGEAEIAQGDARTTATRGRELIKVGSAQDCLTIRARGERLLGHAEESRQHLDAAVSAFTRLGMPYEAARARLTLAEVARALAPQVAEAEARTRRIAFDLMLRAAESITASNPAIAARTLVDAGRLAWIEADPPMMIEVGRRMDALDLPADTPELFAVDLMKGLFRVLEGDPVRAAPLIGSSIGRVDPQDPRQLHLAGVAAMFTRDDRMARELLAQALSRAREIGGIGLLPPILFAVALLQTWEGAYPAARVHATEGERLARDTGQDHLIAHFLGILAWIAAVRGEVESATQLAARTRELGREYRVRPAIAIGTWAMALSEIGAGKWAEAAVTLETMVPLGAADNHPVISLQASADMIEAAQRAERPELAHEIFQSFAGFGRGIVAPWTLALLARGRAFIANDAEAAEAAYEEALGHHAHSERRFEEARTRLVYGEHLRRLKRRSEARTQLRSALDIFERLGAAPWEERARSELRATGETARKRDPSTLDQLTPQELQIVRRVAEGATNKEVAAQLFISPRTVAYHLRNVFAKLGISSRAELIRLSSLPVPSG